MSNSLNYVYLEPLAPGPCTAAKPLAFKLGAQCAGGGRRCGDAVVEPDFARAGVATGAGLPRFTGNTWPQAPARSLRNGTVAFSFQYCACALAGDCQPTGMAIVLRPLTEPAQSP
jgi:hypothetical protein